MKQNTLILFVLSLFFCNTAVHSQTRSWYVYDSNGNVKDGSNFKNRPGKPLELKDSLTGTRYILDADQITVTAIDPKGKTLWKTDPWKDNKIGEYRTSRPVIVNFYFTEIPDYMSDRIKKGTTVMAIFYNNTQFGILDSKGKYYFMGQD